MTSLTYAQAGVDIDRGDALVDAIGPLAAATHRPGVMAGLGGFAALFDVKAAGFRDPLIVSSTDGVGTKLDIAKATGRHDTIGIDLVAMCVNDLICAGATPLFFLDYFATGRLETGVATEVIKGIAEGCRQAGCALVGGETAEMPGLYGAGAYDLAGFAVGAVERDRVLPNHGAFRAGDVLIGLPSSGVHSNGFSLVRKVVDRWGKPYDSEAPFSAGVTLGEALLTPTRLYVKQALALTEAGLAHGFAHITGGGLPGNGPRMLPDGLGLVIDPASWQEPAVFGWLRQSGAIAEDEMRRVFNLGIGLVVAVPAETADVALTLLADMDEKAFVIGHVESIAAGAAPCRFTA
jgi:phosphoribosylformylglycinamidine cyclo-ligase